MLTLIDPDYASPAWETLPAAVRQEVRQLLNALRGAPQRGVVKWLQDQAQHYGIAFGTLKRKYYDLEAHGGDWTVLVDKSKAVTMRAEVTRTKLPRFAGELLRRAETHGRKSAPAIRELKSDWAKRKGIILGYEDWPGWPQLPAGWSTRNLTRIIEDETNLARMRSIRIGTSSKTNPYLPTVLTTRVGLWPGAVIQLDDVWHDNMVTYGKDRKPARVLELGALDLFSACRFHWGAKPRLRRENGTWETIGGADMRMFMAGLLHGTGYSKRGTSFMSEHATAKISEDIARVLYDATGGVIRVDYQPIEGKQAALNGYWSGTEGGNFRAKACLESTHNLIHNDLGRLPMQLGSPSSGIKAPVVTERQLAYIERILRDVAKRVPQRLQMLMIPTWDFHCQFIPWLTDYYQFGLNGRTDHNIEGWEALMHVVNEYTSIPGSDQFFSEDVLLSLPAASQAIIAAAAQQDPQQWTRRRNLSPMEVWKRRSDFLPIPPTVICDILGQDLAREVTSRRGYLTFSDKSISADPLIYVARYCSGPNRGREIHHGEKVLMFAMPFDDTTAICVDAKGRFLGEVPLYKRVLPINPEAFHTTESFENRPELKSDEFFAAVAQKHSRIADILEPSRILHTETVQEAKDLRAHNKNVISGAPASEQEHATARNEKRHTKSAAKLGRAVTITTPEPVITPVSGEIEDWTHTPEFTEAEASFIEDWSSLSEPSPRHEHPTETTESW